MNRATCAAALLLAILVLPGCTQADPRSLPDVAPTTSTASSTAPTTGPTTSPSPEAAPLNPAQVRRRLERKDTGHFISTYQLDGVSIVKDGVYRIGDASSLSDATVSVPDGTELRVRALVVDGTTFGQVDNGGEVSLQRCWFRYDDLPLSGAVAPEIATLLSARDDGDGTTADLATTASAFGSDFVTNLGITRRTGARTPITLDFTGDVLAGWHATPRDVLDAAAASGLSVPAATYQESDQPLTVRLDRFGEDVDLEAPARRRQIPFDPTASQAEVESAITRCEAR